MAERVAQVRPRHSPVARQCGECWQRTGGTATQHHRIPQHHWPEASLLARRPAEIAFRCLSSWAPLCRTPPRCPGGGGTAIARRSWRSWTPRNPPGRAAETAFLVFSTWWLTTAIASQFSFHLRSFLIWSFKCNGNVSSFVHDAEVKRISYGKYLYTQVPHSLPKSVFCPWIIYQSRRFSISKKERKTHCFTVIWFPQNTHATKKKFTSLSAFFHACFARIRETKPVHHDAHNTTGHRGTRASRCLSGQWFKFPISKLVSSTSVDVFWLTLRQTLGMTRLGKNCTDWKSCGWHRFADTVAFALLTKLLFAATDVSLNDEHLFVVDVWC